MAGLSVTVSVDDIRDVFREVSPYITRQWKEVCRDLGVQEVELNQLESESFSKGLSNLAYKGLCLWYDRSRGTAKKERLTIALQRCGLRRAEEEIENIQMKKLMVKSSPVVPSRPSSSRATSARRRIKSGHTSRPPSCAYASIKPRPPSGLSTRSRPPTGHGNASLSRPTSGSGCIAQPQGYLARPHSRNGSARNHSKHKVYRKKKSDRGDASCDLCVRVNVLQVTPLEIEENPQMQPKEVAEKFYDTVLENTEPFSQSLEASIGLREVTVKQICRGSLCIHLTCTTLGSLESLNQMFKSRRLLALCNSVFLTSSVLEQICVKYIKLQVDIDMEELENCRELLVSRKFRESKHIHPADTLTSPMEDLTLEHIPVSTDVTVIHKAFNVDEWRRQLSEEVDSLKARHKQFYESHDQFLRTLQMIMPKGKQEINCLSEVIDLYTYLLGSSGVYTGVRTDLVREFLFMVNNIRIIVDDIHKNSKSVFQLNDDDDIQIMGCLVEDIQEMLNPTRAFEEDVSVLEQKVGAAEKQFTGLLCFIPLLLAKLSTVLYTLSAPN